MGASTRKLIGRTLEHLWSRDVAVNYRDAVMLETAGIEAIEAYQLAKLNRLVAHFRSMRLMEKVFERANSPSTPLKSLAEMDALPRITKDDIVDHLSAIAAGPMALRYNSTSGSTGRNFAFYQSKSMLVGRRAAFRRGREWMGIDPYCDRAINVWGRSPKISLRHKVKNALKLFLSNGIMLDGFFLDRERCLAHLRRIGQIKPRLLEGYPNYLLAIVRAGRETGVEPFRPHAMTSSGETLYEETREEIEGYFGAPLHNRYGSREFGPVAHECPQRESMHLHAHRFIVETDSDGELLITDLDNLATPFIRYRVGDSGKVMNVKCGCGRTLPSLVEMSGRSHDVIQTPAGKQLPGQFWTLVSRAVPGIEEFQVVQRTPTDLEMRIKVTNDYSDETVDVLHDKVREQAGTQMTFSVVKVEHIEPTTAGKRRFVINLTKSGSNGNGA